ncbi:DinB family protein [Flavobacterium anhuiense]|uniref:DinB family protein n=1 Tax=Flavobacterium anhuiense TaxID=459526 RepID=UPI003D9600D3
MESAILKFEELLNENVKYFPTIDQDVLEAKKPKKWSKKEILGHLVDSAVHNLVRFTEINYVDKPYKRRTYDPDALVDINKYQAIDIEELTQLWFVINKQLVRLMKTVDEKALNYEIDFGEGSPADLRFLMTDYVEHLEHHINQIKS